MGSQHNELLQSDLGIAIKAIIGDKEHDSALERWGETLQPVLNPWERLEWELLRREKGYGLVWTTAVAPAARRAALKLNIVAATVSNVVIVPKLLVLSDRCLIGWDNVSASANPVTVTPYSTDIRNRVPANGNPSKPISHLLWQTVDYPNTAPVWPTWDTLAANQFVPLPRWVIQLGSVVNETWNIVQVAVASSFSGAIFFTEREVKAGELG